MRRVALRSVIVGGIVDWFASSLLGAVSVVVVLLILSIRHTPQDAVPGTVTATVHGSPWYIALQIVLGGGCSLLGGYIAARLARHDMRLNGALSSIISLVSIAGSIALGPDSEQLLAQLLILPVKPALGFAGGYLCEARRTPRLAEDT